MTDHITSDWHLFHRRIQEFCPFSRKGSNVEEMSTMIGENVLNTLSPGDTLFNLGDISFGNEDDTFDLLMKIKDAGIKHILVYGNHDTRIRNSLKLQSCFESVHDYLDITIGKKTYVVMSHFPLSTWHRSHHGAYHFHGHSHSTYQPQDGKRRMDVGIDSRPSGDMMPWRLDEVIEILKPNAFGVHHD